MPFLLTINIGPVQEFIASARRSRDLWFGSWLLSELSKAAALKLVECSSDGVNCLVFPAPNTVEQLKKSDFSVANKIVAVVEGTPQDVGEAVEAAIQKRLLELSNTVYAGIARRFNEMPIYAALGLPALQGNGDTARLQITDLIECMWVALPLPEETDYAGVRGVSEALMGQRKNTRNFGPVAWGAHVPKSSLDGQRESVIPEEVYADRTAGRERRLRHVYGVRPGERLCGVGLLKRHGQRGQDAKFFSTSHVAALPLLARWDELEMMNKDVDPEAAMTSYINFLTADLRLDPVELGNVANAGFKDPIFCNQTQDRHYDGHLLFEERLVDFFTDEAHLKAAKAALQELLQALSPPGKLLRPQPYYALLLADGDRMGAAIDHQKERAEHRALSGKLTEFAEAVQGIVTANSGSLVYAGGDDVLAFLPLHTVLPCADELRRSFAGALEGFPTAEGEKPTLSVGIAVCHHLDPLSDALTLARGAEKSAKAVPGKNALAVTVSKRSGSDRTVSGTWGELDTRLQNFIELHRRDEIPDGLAYEWRDLAVRLNFTSLEPHHAMLREMLRGEALRLLGRKRAARGSTPAAHAATVLEELLPAGGQLKIGDLAEEIITARIFADAADLAYGPMPPRVVEQEGT